MDDTDIHLPEQFLRGPADLGAICGKTIALFSGSFNPPHDGHRKLAELALYFGIESVIFCPHSRNPEKHGSLAPMADRLTMLSVLLQASPFVEQLYVLDPAFIESFREPASYARIRKHLPAETSLSILVGSDSIRDDYPEFLRSHDHLVVERDARDKRYTKILSQRYVALPELNITSSSKIRSSYQMGNGTHLDPRLHAYIVEKGLFV